MPQTRISASSYSNTAPLIWSFLYGSMRGRYELILDNAPARSAELLREKRVDAALVPVIEYQRIPKVFLVPDVCVGAAEKVRSVCLVTKGAEPENVKTLALDISSRTSVALTKIIFREFLGFDPVYQKAKPDLKKMLENADAALLIGDPALSIADSKDRLRKFDLVEIWREFTGFGFIFAMWMSANRKCGIDFPAARDEGLIHLDEIISNYETQIPLKREDFKTYLSQNISYTISDPMQKGLELFFELAHKNDLIEDIKSLDFTE